MQYGICHLGLVPLRFEPRDTSEMVSQLLYGEQFKILEKRNKWSKIRLSLDHYEAWIDNKQYLEISETQYNLFDKEEPKLVSDLVDFVSYEDEQLMPIPIGSNLIALDFFKHQFQGASISKKQAKTALIDTALLFLNAPYLWGGKTSFGIDCSGFTQMVYRLNGHNILRDASQQATQGTSLSFIEESEPGDLAFFDNAEGKITHVGIMMKDNYIIHAHGKVRIDRIDHTGIFNKERGTYSHPLRVIKKII